MKAVKSPDVLRKLRLSGTGNILIVNAPKEYASLLEGVEYDSKPSKKKEGSYDFVQVFGTTQSELEKLIQGVAPYGRHGCLFWACYPKLGGALTSDIKRETVWKALGFARLRPVAQIAIDSTWSALRGRPREASARQSPRGKNRKG